MVTTELTRRFNNAMLGIYDAARNLRPSYTPADFRKLVIERGGKGAAVHLLGTDNPSAGFTELLLRGRENLKLSVEYLVLEDPWRELFEPDQLRVAERRLKDVRCELPPGAEEYLVSLNSQAMKGEPRLPEELPGDGTKYREGVSKPILVNAYERNPEARARCIAHYGPRCAVCDFSFSDKYGPTAAGYIHVHHLRPIASVGKSYEVDPIQDLRPVCPNCHAVIHLGGACRSIDEVRALVASRARTV